MALQKLSNKANKAITLWAKDKNKLVIAIDGYPGIGKTTLLNNLANLNPDIVSVNRDDFIFSRKVIREELAKTRDKSRVFEFQVLDNKKLEDFIYAFRNTSTPYKVDTYDSVYGEINIPKAFDFSKKIIVVEGIFMFHPKLPFNKIWDKKIYMEGDISKLDERRIKREQNRWGKNYFPETHPDSYLREIVDIFKRYIDLYHPEKNVDLVLKVD